LIISPSTPRTWIKIDIFIQMRFFPLILTMKTHKKQYQHHSPSLSWPSHGPTDWFLISTPSGKKTICQTLLSSSHSRCPHRSVAPSFILILKKSSRSHASLSPSKSMDQYATLLNRSKRFHVSPGIQKECIDKF
jgi:hypothetical protein